MSSLKEFDEQLREELSSTLRRTYRTVRHGGHPTDKDEFLRHREFWPDMRFDEAKLLGGPGERRELAITFAPVNETGASYGYRVDLDDALAKWATRVTIRDPMSNPSMFAAEIIWYMVAYIGSNDIAAAPLADDGIRWINTGLDLFEKLPEPPGFAHAASAPTG
jgi:hypothetical protein